MRGKIRRENEEYKYREDGKTMEKQKREGNHNKTFENIQQKKYKKRVEKMKKNY